MLKPGDKVIMENCCEADKNKDKVWTCRSNEWKMCGSTVILLEGKAGGFDVSCLKKVGENA
jgi:hypothetical protein